MTTELEKRIYSTITKSQKISDSIDNKQLRSFTNSLVRQMHEIYKDSISIKDSYITNDTPPDEICIIPILTQVFEKYDDIKHRAGLVDDINNLINDNVNEVKQSGKGRALVYHSTESNIWVFYIDEFSMHLRWLGNLVFEDGCWQNKLYDIGLQTIDFDGINIDIFKQNIYNYFNN